MTDAILAALAFIAGATGLYLGNTLGLVAYLVAGGLIAARMMGLRRQRDRARLFARARQTTLVIVDLGDSKLTANDNDVRIEWGSDTIKATRLS